MFFLDFVLRLAWTLYLPFNYLTKSIFCVFKIWVCQKFTCQVLFWLKILNIKMFYVLVSLFYYFVSDCLCDLFSLTHFMPLVSFYIPPANIRKPLVFPGKVFLNPHFWMRSYLFQSLKQGVSFHLRANFVVVLVFAWDFSSRML